MLLHREPMTSGVHTAERPRGLHPSLFGPGGLGVFGLADRLIPLVRRVRVKMVFLWCPLGVEPDGTISDRPFERATTDFRAGDLPGEWFRRLCNLDEWAANLARVKVAGGCDIGVHIGRPTSKTPDAAMLSLASAGCIDFISWDNTAHQDESERRDQWDAYSACGVRHGYEAVPNYGMDDLWGNPKHTLVVTLDGLKASQDRIARAAPHPNINVHLPVVRGPVLILDTHDNVPASLDHISKGRTVAANLLAPAWTNHLAQSAGGAA